MANLRNVDEVLFGFAKKMNDTANFSYEVEFLPYEEKVTEMKNPKSSYNVNGEINKKAKNFFKNFFVEAYSDKKIIVGSKSGLEKELEFHDLEIKALHCAYDVLFKDKGSDKLIRVYCGSEGISFVNGSLKELVLGEPELNSDSIKTLNDLFKYHK